MVDRKEKKEKEKHYIHIYIYICVCVCFLCSFLIIHSQLLLSHISGFDTDISAILIEVILKRVFINSYENSMNIIFHSRNFIQLS